MVPRRHAATQRATAATAEADASAVAAVAALANHHRVQDVAAAGVHVTRAHGVDRRTLSPVPVAVPAAAPVILPAAAAAAATVTAIGWRAVSAAVVWSWDNRSTLR